MIKTCRMLCTVIFARHTSPEASAIGVTNALFQFHSSHFLKADSYQLGPCKKSGNFSPL